MFDFVAARTNMVDSQIRPNGVTDARVIEAMQSVSREDFVSENQRTVAYMDGDVALASAGSKRSLIEPMAFAKMLQAAEIRPTDHVLEIGTATGYGAKVLSGLAKYVVSIDSDEPLVALARSNLSDKVNVSLIEGPMGDGHPKAGPYDLILISGQVEVVPKALFSQLSEGGRLIATVGTGGVGMCSLWVKSGETCTQRSLFNLSIATLPGFEIPNAGFAF